MYMERRIFSQYQTRTQGRDSSNLISLSVPTTNNYFYDLSLFFKRKIVSIRTRSDFEKHFTIKNCDKMILRNVLSQFFIVKIVSKTFFLSPLHVAQYFGHSAHFTFHHL